MGKHSIRADELIMAFEAEGIDIQHFLDRQTGEMLLILGWEEEPEGDEQERIEADPERYLRIDPAPSHVGYEIMSDFVDTLPEGKAKRELDWALGQKKPFRRFKDKLFDYPQVRVDWFRFHEQEFVKIIQDWLEDHGVEIDIVPSPWLSQPNGA